MLTGYQTVPGAMASCRRVRFLSSTVRMVAVAMAACWALASNAGAELLAPLAHVERSGEGDRHMVLIPGLGQDWSVWEGFMDRNAEKYTMHAVTLPGFGGSEPPPLPEDASRVAWLTNAVEAVASMLEEAQLENVTVMGHGSLGGFVALRLGMERPELVEHIVAIDALPPALPLPGSATGVVPLAERLQLVEMLGPMFLQLDEAEWHQNVQNLSDHAIDAEFAAAMQKISKKTNVRVGARYLVELMSTDLAESLRVNMIGGDATALLIYTIGEEDGPASMPRQMRRAKGISAQIMKQSFGATVVEFHRSRPFVMHDHPGAFDGVLADYLAGDDVYDYIPPSPRRGD